MPFFIIFVIIPFAEIMVFMAVGEHIGLFTTLLLAFLTAVIGGGIVKHQGLKTLAQVQGAMKQGQIPAGALFDGLCLVAAGATLITPGFITDFIGFALLVPQIRELLAELLKKHTKIFAEKGSYQGASGDIIDGEFEDVDPARSDDIHLKIIKEEREP